MKVIQWAGLFLIASIVFNRGFEPISKESSGSSGKIIPNVKSRRAHETEFEVVRRYNAPGGEARIVTNRFLQFQSGLNYFDGQQWAESDETISLIPGGAEAIHAQHKVLFPASILSPDGIRITTGGGQVLKAGVAGFSYFDSSSGQSVELGAVKDVVGELLDATHVIYRDAFTGVSADVIYVNKKSGLEQFVVLRENPPSPAVYGLNPETTRLESYTEFMEAPLPEKTVRFLETSMDAGKRDGFVEPDLVDETLKFGSMTMVPGRAFSIPQETSDDKSHAAKVGKQWKEIDGRKILIEGVPYEKIREKLEVLPAKKTALKQAKKGRAFAVLKREKVGRKELKVASRGSFIEERGFAMDYEIVNTTTDQRFEANKTYFVTGTSWLYGTTTIEGAATIKFTNNVEDLILIIEGPVECKTTAYNRAVFTAMDDDSIGEALPSSSSHPTNYYATAALWIGDSGSVLQYLRFCYASEGLVYDHDTTADHFISHSEFLHCERGILAMKDFYARNILMFDVLTNFYTTTYDCTGRVEQGTFHQASVLSGSDGTNAVSLILTNTLIAEVTSLGNGYSTNSQQVGLSSTNVFQTVGAGAHYLMNGSSYRNAGTTNINPVLRWDLRSKTTYPPTILGNITNGTQIGQVVQRDSDVPDLGYHYDPLDYLAGGVEITNATLTITNGCVVGLYGDGPTASFRLRNGGRLETEGSFLKKNLFVRYNLSQEQANSTWAASTMGTTIYCTDSGAGASIKLVGAELRGPVYHICAMSGVDSISIRDSELHFGFVTASETVLGVTNVLSDSVEWLSSATNLTASFRNNLFLDGSLLSDWQGTSSISLRDNFFHRILLIDAAPVEHDYNAYIAGDDYKWNYSGSYDTNGILLTNWVFALGPIGDYYLPQSSALINAGSRAATDALLDQYTTDISESLESSSTVDIGLHYPIGPLNLARSGSASQSSTLYGGDPELAIDGNRDGDFAQGTVSHTGEDSNAWWQVDLGGTNAIESIQVWNRTDCCSDRLHDFYVFVSTEAFSSSSLSTTLAQSGVSAYFVDRPSNATALLVNRSGRYVRIQLTETNYLHMGEVLVLEQGEGTEVEDSDHDGLPDTWETSYFGNLNQDGAGDWDGDGFTNQQEYENGTSPVAFNGLTIFTPLK